MANHTSPRSLAYLRVSTSRITLSPCMVCPSSRTSDRAGRVRAPTHAHPVFDDKISTPTHPLGECLSNTPTHPAHRKKTEFGVGARSPLKRHPVARLPVGLEAGVPTSGASRWPLHHNSVIFGDPERYQLKCILYVPL